MHFAARLLRHSPLSPPARRPLTRPIPFDRSLIGRWRDGWGGPYSQKKKLALRDGASAKHQRDYPCAEEDRHGKVVRAFREPHSVGGPFAPVCVLVRARTLWGAVARAREPEVAHGSPCGDVVRGAFDHSRATNGPPLLPARRQHAAGQQNVR